VLDLGVISSPTCTFDARQNAKVAVAVIVAVAVAGAAITYRRNSYNGSCHSTGGMEDGAWSMEFRASSLGIRGMGIGMGMYEDSGLNSMFG